MQKQTSDRMPNYQIKKMQNSELLMIIADNENPNSSKAAAEFSPDL